MSWTRWAILLALYGLVALAIPLVGYSLPPCFGNAEGHISAGCVAHWEAAMPVFPQRFVYQLGVAMSAVISLLGLTGITVVLDLARRSRRRRRPTLRHGD